VAERHLALVSVVAPMLNEEGTARIFCDRVRDAMDGLPWELVIVDDGSKDGTPAILAEIAAADARIKVLTLSRNFGHQMAITAGLDHATGDAVVMIDADLQDPPELIPTMVEHWRAGSDVVYTTRTDRAGESRFKLTTARWFYGVMAKVSDVPLVANAGDFRLLDRTALDALLQMRERNRYLRGMTLWVGYTQTALAFLAVPVAIGFRIFGQFLPGITSTVVAVLLLGGIQLIAIGLIGEYVGRIYDEVKRRPLYIVRERANFGVAEDDRDHSTAG